MKGRIGERGLKDCGIRARGDVCSPGDWTAAEGLVREEAKAGASDGLELVSHVPLWGRPWRLPVGVNQREKQRSHCQNHSKKGEYAEGHGGIQQLTTRVQQVSPTESHLSDRPAVYPHDPLQSFTVGQTLCWDLGM